MLTESQEVTHDDSLEVQLRESDTTRRDFVRGLARGLVVFGFADTVAVSREALGCPPPCTDCTLVCASACDNGCDNSCDSSCGTSCDSGCGTGCDSGCGEACDSGCGTSCDGGCGSSCDSGCGSSVSVR